jgi:outer membrane protein assembly factor BamD (BamD/ComL family)
MNLAKRLAALLLIALFAGCSNKNIDTAKLQSLFQDSGDNKVFVDQGVDAISKTNYPAALETLEKLAYRPHLTKEQRETLQDVISKLKDRVRK